MRGLGAFGAIALVLLVSGSGPALAGAPSDHRLLVLDGETVKWGAPVLGTGATVTYALVASATDFPDARNCRSVVPLGPLLAANSVPSAQFAREVTAAFAAWSAVANIVFVPDDPATADILIGAQGDPYGRAFTNVAHAVPSGEGTAPIARSVICLNPAQRWKVGFDGDLDVYDLRYTLEHEIGHAIGLDHPGVAGVMMDFRYREKFDGPQPGDIAGALALYGAKGATPPVAAVAAPARGTTEVGLGVTAVKLPDAEHLFRP
ncbi:MAG TPA: matrixin family metalloprotease [Bauldia sp.]|nr:matrixin family metalloprotease [Bauldia sp.]